MLNRQSDECTLGVCTSQILESDDTRSPSFLVPCWFSLGTCFLSQQPWTSMIHDTIERNVAQSTVETVNYSELGTCAMPNRHWISLFCPWKFKTPYSLTVIRCRVSCTVWEPRYYIVFKFKLLELTPCRVLLSPSFQQVLHTWKGLCEYLKVDER